MTDKIIVRTKGTKTLPGVLVEPQFVPGTCNIWKEKSYVEQRNYRHWWYKDTATGERLFLKYKIPKPTEEKPHDKGFQYMSMGSGKYYKENLWTKVTDFKLPLYRGDILLKEDPGVVHLCEGENTCDIAQVKFPHHFWVTFGSPSGFRGYDYSILEGREVILHPDVDKKGGGLKQFKELAFYLKHEYGIHAKIVDLPLYNDIVNLLDEEFTKNGWDYADDIPEQIDIEELIVQAKEPIEEAPLPFSDIRSQKKDFVYIRNLGDRYFDKVKSRICSQVEINNLFLRDDTLRETAHKWLQKNGIEIADGTTFYPVDKQFIQRGDSNYINLYRAPVHENLGEIADIEDRVAWFINHLKYLMSYEEEETQILIKLLACAVQYPELNRGWCLLLTGGHGIGKGILFQIIEYLVGEHNSSQLELDQLYSKFNSFMMKSNNLFITEGNSKGKEDTATQAKIKNLLTEKKFEVELKGKDTMTHYCHYNLYISSNEINPIKTDAKDDDEERRFCYMRCDQPKKGPAYYKDIWNVKLSSKQTMKELGHYFKHVVKVSRDECLDFYSTAPWTIWKPQFVLDSKTWIMKEILKVFEEKLIPSFHWQVYNINQVYKELRHFLYNDMRNEGFILSEPFKKYHVQNLFHELKLVPFRYGYVMKNGKKRKVSQAVEPKTPQNHKPRGHYHTTLEIHQKHSHDIKWLNEHFSDPLVYARAHNEKVKQHHPGRLNERGEETHIGDLLETDRTSIF
jgi:hypothetical protein